MIGEEEEEEEMSPGLPLVRLALLATGEEEEEEEQEGGASRAGDWVVLGTPAGHGRRVRE